MAGSRVVLELQQVTPALVGYVEPQVVDNYYYLRPSSLKGVWRWTARALVGGALYELDRLCGVPSRDIVKLPRQEEVRAVSQIVGKYLGLGYAGGEDARASVFSIRVEVVRKPRVMTATSGMINVLGLQRVRLQRVQLLTLGRRRVQYFTDGAFRVVIEPRKTLDKGLEAGLRSLILALTIAGLGKGSRRGLGSFDIVSVKGLHIENRFRDFVESTYQLVLDIVKKSDPASRLSTCRKGLPPHPVISKSMAHGINVTRMFMFTGVSWIHVHNFFVRTERCRRLAGRPQCRDQLRQNLAAWILGLPRQQRGTGYMLKEGISRRASPIIVSAHNKSHVLGAGVYVTVLVSGDWPTTIKWRGAGHRQLHVDEKVIVNAINIATNELLAYMGQATAKPVWP